LDDVAAERPALPRKAEEHGDLAAPYGLQQARRAAVLAPARHARRVLGHAKLVLLQPGPAGDDETPRVDDVDARLGLLAAQPLVDETLDDLQGHAHAPRAGAVDEDHLLRQRALRA